MRPAFFAFYPADFANDIHVEAMSTLQVGAYVLLLCKAWQGDPPASLPDDDQILARFARVDAAVWGEIRAGVLAPFRLGTDGRLHSKRLRLEYDAVLKRMRVARENGRKGGRPKGGDGDGVAAGGKPRGLPGGLPPGNPTLNRPGKPTESSESPVSGISLFREEEEKNNPPSEGCGVNPAGPPGKPKSPRKVPDAAHHRAVAAFTTAWAARYGEKYPFDGGKDGKLVKDLLAHVGGDEAKFAAVVGRYLADDDPFVADKRHTLGMLRAQLPKWLVEGGHGKSGGGSGAGVGRPGRAVPPPGKYDRFGTAPGVAPPRGEAGPAAGGNEAGAA